MSELWPRAPLSRALTHRSEFITIDDTQTYKRCRVQVNAQGVVLRDKLEGAAIKTKSQQVCRAGEFLVAEIDAKVGGFGIVPPELDGAIVSSHYFLFEIDEAQLDRRFLDYYIRTHDFRGQVAAQGSTNYAAIRPAHVLGYQMPVPPLPEQQRIVARIEELAGRVAEATALKEQSTPLATTYWKSLSKQARSGAYPNRPLEEIVEFLDGRRIPLSSAERADRKGPYPYYGASGIIDHVDDFLFDEDLLLLSEDGANLLNRTTPIAFVATGKYWVNNHAHVLRPVQDRVRLWFLEYALADYDVSDLNFASAQAKLNQRNAQRIRIPVPPVEEQDRIVAKLDSLAVLFERAKALQQQTTTALDALLPSILDKAFRGEL